MEVITYKCPNCGGDLTFDPASGKYKCEYCLSSFTQEEAEKANPKAAEALNGEDDAAGAQEASDAQKESSTEETKGETEQGEAVVYTCPNCGAEIVTDATTAATYCFYCHNPVVLSGRLSGEYMPDFVLPFKISKEQAIEKFLHNYIGNDLCMVFCTVSGYVDNTSVLSDSPCQCQTESG